jgi:SAM-dependent methyltransferase
VTPKADRFRPRWLLASVALLVVACIGAEPGVPEPDAPSARPGINDTFLDPDLDVEEWTKRFEGESREIAVHRAEIVARLGLEAGDSVADVGAGTGLFLAPFAAAVGSGGHVYAVDISPRFLEHLHRRAEDEGLAQVSVVEGKERSVNLPEASLDLAFVCDTYHHFEHPDASLASLWRAIRPGGALVVIDFERIPGKTRDWLMEHVRAGKEVFTGEIEAAGFVLEEEITDVGLVENYMLRFRRP